MARLFGTNEWTPEEDARFLEMRGRGEPRHAIGTALGRTLSSLKARLGRLIGPKAQRRRGMKWSEEKSDELRGLVAQGLTSTQIGKIMGVTRNAIIGRCHRLGLTLGQAGPGHKVRVRRAVPHRKPTKVAVSGPPTASERVSEIKVRRQVLPYGPTRAKPDAADHVLASISTYASELLQAGSGCCRYPLSDGHMCGARAVDLKPYCERHRALTGHTYKPKGGVFVLGRIASRSGLG